MEHKTWLWRKKSSEKTIVTSKEADFYLKGIEDETLLTEKKVGEDRSTKNSKESLACNAKDDLVNIHAKMAEEAIAGLEKAEAEVVSLKQERDEALQLGVAANERLTQLDVTLKECMQQLASVQQEEEQRIQDAVTKTSRNFEKAQRILEEKLRDTSKRLANITAENSRLTTALQDREKLMGELNKCKSQSEAEFNALMARLESTEKENTFLRYEFRMLEKELEIRNEEREYNRRSTDALQKQQLDSVKKITKLEAECQRLRSLLRKRLPGPAALAKMKGEVDMLGRDQTETRRRQFNPTTGGLVVRSNTLENTPENPSIRAGILIKRLDRLEEENKILKEIVNEKNNELHASRIVFAQTSSKLAQLEAQNWELSRDEKSMEHSGYNPTSNELSLMSGFEVGNDVGVISSGSWANALISELEHFRSKDLQGPKRLGVSDMRLMDDFVEMEKLAIVSVDMPLGNSHVSSFASSASPNTLGDESDMSHFNSMGKELVPVAQEHSSFSNPKWEVQTLDGSIRRSCNWLQGVLKAILEQNSTVSEDYVVNIFKWKRSELSAVLQKFICTCNDLSHGKAGFETFVGELTHALEWIMSSCITHQDVSSVRDIIKQQFGLNEPQSHSEDKVEVNGTASEPDKAQKTKEQSSKSPLVTLKDAQNALIQLQNIEPSVQEEGLQNKLNDMDLAKKDLELKLQSATNKNEALMKRLHESERCIGRLQMELETLKASKEIFEGQLENQNSINEDLELDTQLTVAKAKLNEVIQKFSSLEVELEDKRNCCEELEATCLELQLQLESVSKKDIPKRNADLEEKQMQNGWEITTASLKLAECQETILNLGKQLKALASPREAALFEKVFATTNNKNLRERCSLRDKILAEDDAKGDGQKSPMMTELVSRAEKKNPSVLPYDNYGGSSNSVLVEPPQLYHGSKYKASSAGVGPLAIVPAKKQKAGGGFLRKLLLRRKKASNKKTSLTFGVV